MSLLTNPWLAVSMGLLANNGPSLTPVNPWRGIGEGLMNAQNAQYAEQHSAYEQMRMQQEQQKIAAEQERQKQLQAAIQGLPPEQQQLAMASPDAFFKARIDQQFAKPAESVSIKTAGELGLQGYAPETPVEVKMNGGQIVDYTPMTPPAAPQGPTSIQEFNLAQTNPEFAAYQERMARANASQVNIGGEKLPANFRWVDPADPSKGVEPIPGGPATMPTEGQGLAGGFYDRMASSSEILDTLEDSGYDPSTLSHAAVPDMLAPPETQQYRQAQRDWVRAKLRKESGAAISEKEMADEIKTYFPQPNESSKSIAQKRRARAVAERAMYKQAGPANAGMAPPPPAGFVIETP